MNKSQKVTDSGESIERAMRPVNLARNGLTPIGYILFVFEEHPG